MGLLAELFEERVGRLGVIRGVLLEGFRDERLQGVSRARDQFMEQAPGPRGSPHEPQPREGAVSARPPPEETAKTERSLRRFRLSHAGQTGRVFPETNCSKLFPHARQRYS
jgi:hypothetical protein